MKQKLIIASIACILALALISSNQSQAKAKTIRVGVYDNRAIALAYFGSDYNHFLKKREEFQKAQASGDSVQIKALNAWVEKFQRKLHFQGFCRAPVDDLLLLVQDKIPGLLESTGVDLITWYPDYTGVGVETVDITNQLVALFDPTEGKLKEIEALKGTEPAALADIEHNH